jgi:deoxyadenosine/deoxycytidine kinase
MAACCLVIDGLIGAGKTTLIASIVAAMSEYYDVHVIPEPVDNWVKSGILAEFYKDQTRYAYTFQTEAFRTRLVKMREVYESAMLSLSTKTQSLSTTRPVLFISERSTISDKIFAKLLHTRGQMTDMEYGLYCDWWEFWHILMPPMTIKHLYMRVDVEVSLGRIMKRGRTGENVPDDYQRALFVAHEEFFSARPHLVIDGVAEFEDKKLSNTAIDRILAYIK